MTEKLTLNDLLLADARDPGCEAGAEFVDQYVELELAGKNPAAPYPVSYTHLTLPTN